MSSVCFGRFMVRPAERLLLADGVPVQLGDRALDLLLALLERPGQLVDKHTLLERVWPDRLMADSNLTVQVSALRRVLGRDALRTVAGRGYQLTLPVQGPMPLALAPSATVPGVRWQAPTGRHSAAVESDSWQAPEAPLLLCAQLAAGSQAAHPGAADRSASAWFDRAFKALVSAHGGQLLQAGAQRWLASYYSVRDALACCAQLQDHLRGQTLGQPAGQLRLQLALHRAEGPPHLAADTVQRLAALAEDGQILASAGAASRFVPALDGDMEDLGERHLALHLGPQRVYRLTPGLPGSGPGRLVGQVADLRPAVAVLPPSSVGDRPGATALGDIVADQLISALSRSPVLSVISRLSTQSLQQRALDALQVGRMLNADFVVSGHCVLSGGRLRVMLELADGRSGRVIDTHSSEDADHAALHADSHLVQSLVAGITRNIFDNEMMVARTAPLPTLASHTLLLAGISLMYRLAPNDFQQGYKALHMVRERAPRHSAPLAWLARWHLFCLVQGWSEDRQRDGRLAIDYAERALDLDPESSLALTMLGNAHTSYLRDLTKAEQHFEMALAINPNESLAWLQLGNARSFAGDGRQALAHTQRAVGLSPLDPARHYYLSIMASAALSAQDFERAISAARMSLKLNRTHVSTHRVLAIALSMSQRMDEARAAVGQLRLLEPQLTVARFVERSPGAQSGLAQVFGAALLAAGLPAGS